MKPCNIWNRITELMMSSRQGISPHLWHKLFIYMINICPIKPDPRSGTTGILTPWSRTLLAKLPVAQLLKNFQTFYGTQRFITVLTRALHWSLSWVRSIQSIPPYPISLRSILILSSYLRLVVWFLLALLFPISPNACYMLCPSHPPWLDHSNYTWRRTQVIKLLKRSM
jgi:hypothetical protein